MPVGSPTPTGPKTAAAGGVAAPLTAVRTVTTAVKVLNLSAVTGTEGNAPPFGSGQLGFGYIFQLAATATDAEIDSIYMATTPLDNGGSPASYEGQLDIIEGAWDNGYTLDTWILDTTTYTGLWTIQKCYQPSIRWRAGNPLSLYLHSVAAGVPAAVRLQYRTVTDVPYQIGG